MYRLVVLTSHPIQYQAPLFRKLAATQGVDLVVIFRNKSKKGVFFDKGVGQKVAWDVPLLQGYRSVFLKSPWVITSLFRREHIDSVVIYGWNSFASWWTALSALRLHIPFFIYGENKYWGNDRIDWLLRDIYRDKGKDIPDLEQDTFLRPF